MKTKKTSCIAFVAPSFPHIRSFDSKQPVGWKLKLGKSNLRIGALSQAPCVFIKMRYPKSCTSLVFNCLNDPTDVEQSTDGNKFDTPKTAEKVKVRIYSIFNGFDMENRLI